MFVLPSDPDASRFENRAMADAPNFSIEEFLSGRYFDDLEEYLSDSFAFRTGFLALSAKMESAYGIDIGGAAMVSIDFADLGMGLIADPEIVYVDPPVLRNPGGAGEGGAGVGSAGQGDPASGSGHVGGDPSIVDPGDDPSLAFSYGRRMNPGARPGEDLFFNPNAVFYGGFYVAGAYVASYIETLNLYRGSLPDSVRVFSLLAPTVVEFLDERYRAGSADQLQTIRHIYGRLDESIIAVDAHSKISEHAQDKYLYFRTDHHWTALGAYYAYLAFAEAAGFEPIALDRYVEFAFPGFFGSFVPGTQDRTVLESPDTLYYYILDSDITFSRNLYFIPEDPLMASYMIFLGGDFPLLDFTSSNQNGKTLIVIKDSYANAIIPWLAPHYERIIVADPRLFDGSISALVRELDDVDLVFVTTALTPSLGEFVGQISEIR